jgi:hypothetical protein
LISRCGWGSIRARRWSRSAPGPSKQGEGIVTGDVVNTAARIQSVAPVNSVAVSQQTYRATSRVFEYEPLAPVSVKGKVEPIPLWRAKAARSRFGSDASDRFRTPFVGRELEKPLPIGIFERATQRSVQLVTVVGEPGVGKSRLIAELSSCIDAKPGLFRWRQGRCRPYGEGITLSGRWARFSRPSPAFSSPTHFVPPDTPAGRTPCGYYRQEAAVAGYSRAGDAGIAGGRRSFAPTRTTKDRNLQEILRERRDSNPRPPA